jgi:putative membrane protein
VLRESTFSKSKSLKNLNLLTFLRSWWFWIPLVYGVGVVGMLSPYREIFLILTPFQLIGTAVVLLVKHNDVRKKEVIFFILTALIGFGVEVVGVQTGLIFGHYQYGSALGFQVAGVPLTIALNWFIMVYITGWGLGRIMREFQPFVGALMMTGIDVIIEQVAPKLDFWAFEGESVPIQNYIAWFVIGYGLHFLGGRMGVRYHSKTAPMVSASLFGFFLLLRYLL